MVNPSGCWHQAEKDRTYWRLDAWEDDTRRRRRMVKNPWGSDHFDATNHNAKSNAEKEEEKVPSENGPTPVPQVRPTDAQISSVEGEQSLASLPEEDDLSDCDASPSSLAGPATFSCFSSLIAPGVALPGTAFICKILDQNMH